jgi:hypothetical protein
MSVAGLCMFPISKLLKPENLDHLTGHVIEMADSNRGNANFVGRNQTNGRIDVVEFTVQLFWDKLDLSGVIIKNDLHYKCVTLNDILNELSNNKLMFNIYDVSNYFIDDFQVEDIFYELTINNRATFTFNYHEKLNRLSRMKFFRGVATHSLETSKLDYINRIASSAVA